MAYRSDLDAAHARIAALELELAELRRAQARDDAAGDKLPVELARWQPAVRGSWIMGVGTLAILIGVFGGVLVLDAFGVGVFAGGVWYGSRE